MGFSDADIRASHTIRIFGTNKDKEVLQDIWLDIERIDVFRITTQSPSGQFQGVVRRLYWLDDPDDPAYREDGNPARSEGTLKICAPDEEDQEDPKEWVPVRTIIEMAWNESGDANQWKARRGNRTDAENMARTVEARRCFHRDTIIDDDVEAATDANPDLKAYVVASDRYDFTDVNDETKQDKTDYVEVQYVSFTLDQSSRKEDEDKHQGLQFSLKNSHYLDFSDPAEGPVNPDHGFDPPWALDPFQAIVNVQWTPTDVAVLGIAPTPIINSDYVDSITETSQDGLEWQTEFDGKTSNAASGLGKTVVCSGNKYIAFGKPVDRSTDPVTQYPACFIAAKGFTIERGVLDEHGELQWATVASLPIGGDPLFVGAKSCSFAGGAFFVSYLKDADSSVAAYLAVSFDGETFAQGVNPFDGVIEAANGSGMDPGETDPVPVGGNVAWDKKNEVYVTTGMYNRGYWNLEATGPDETVPASFIDTNFMSAVSTDGIRWRPKFDTSECSGLSPAAAGGIGAANITTSSVTFGNGVFVAASSYKLNYDFFSAPSVVVYKLTALAAAVATSTDGVNWTNHRLPGSISSGWVYGAHVESGGTGSCAGFYKARKKDDSGVAGFFVTTALENPPGLSTLPQNKLWQSKDGSSWTLVRTDAGKTGWILSTIYKSRGTIIYRD
jgi:hypothetical protein